MSFRTGETHDINFGLYLFRLSSGWREWLSVGGQLREHDGVTSMAGVTVQHSVPATMAGESMRGYGSSH